MGTQKRLSEELLQKFKTKWPAKTFTLECSKELDQDTLNIPPECTKAVMQDLHNSYPLLLDVCGVDYPQREKRFDLVYHLVDPHKATNRLRVITQLSEGEKTASVTSIYKSANWFEREAYDMFGIPFENHPNLRRILCHEDFIGHPLRKDYPADKRQSLNTPIEHSFQKDRKRLLKEGEHLSDRVWINIGPAHPATHGTLRFMAILESETIYKMDVEIGYLHRCFEKMAETHTYNQVIPYTDRLNYCSSPLNNNVWCHTIERMLDIKIPERAQVIRVILDEFSRIIDHIVCITTQILDLGALTTFWIGFRAREAVYDLFEKLCGARLTVSLARVGGLGFDLPDGWIEQAKDTCKIILKAKQEIDILATKNRIFVKRMVGVTAISGSEAVNWGFTGPCLRASGVAYDIRKDQPYYCYDQMKFDIPVGHRGDCYDRYLVRAEEMQQSVNIIMQALDILPDGPIRIDDPTISLPNKKDVYNNIEGLMNQFMMVIGDVKPPAGHLYNYCEGANGELGFYVVSDGSGKPYRVKCRPPCFAIFQAFPKLLEGHMLADVIAALGTINIIAGELDR